jgi:long-chain acyl-CoA synthetase
VGRGVDEVNRRFARVETVRKFRILPRNFTLEDGELTPTLKIKRRVVAERWAEVIEEMYAD